MFEVWSGQHRVAAARQFLREQLKARVNPALDLAQDAELGHENAYWFADVYNRSM
jgi:hypothetical protein